MDGQLMCNWLNDQMVNRPSFLMPVLRTQWMLDPSDTMHDIDYFEQSSGLCSTDLICMLNSMLIPTGKQITSVNIQNTIQFILEDRIPDEKVPSAQETE